MLSQLYTQNSQSQQQFSQINATFKSIKIINKLPTTLHFTTKLYLDNNHLMSLNGIQQFHNLQVFHFNYNHISLPSQLSKINNAFFMKDLSFVANPIYYNVEISIQKLKGMGFRRLMLLNKQNRINDFQLTKKRKQRHIHNNKVKNEDNNVFQLTSKRKPNYNEDHVQLTKRTNKKMIGKIYLNKTFNNFTTNRQVQQRKDNTSSHNNIDNKQKQTNQTKSTNNITHNQTTQSHPNVPQFKLSTPYKSQQQDQSNIIYSKQTAKFSLYQYQPYQPYQLYKPQNEQNEDQSLQLGQLYLLQQKNRLAQCYHIRTLMQKSINGFKRNRQIYKEQGDQLEIQDGEMINNSMDNIRFSFIKMKHNSISNKKNK